MHIYKITNIKQIQGVLSDRGNQKKKGYMQQIHNNNNGFDIVDMFEYFFIYKLFYIYNLCSGVEDCSDWRVSDHWKFHDQRFDTEIKYVHIL